MISQKAMRSSLVLLILLTKITIGYAATCNAQECDGYKIPLEIQGVIHNGYENIAVINISGFKYLSVTTKNDVNKCSVLFKIDSQIVNSTPTVGVKEQICNITTHDSNIISSWRDSGKWNDDVYQVNSDGMWKLLFRDSCVGCDQVKRTYFNSGKVSGTSLLADGNNFSDRKPLIGKVDVDKANLYKQPDIEMQLKAYLIKGDSITLIDMSDDGAFYKVKYSISSGKNIFYWIKSDDFSLQ